MPNRKTTPFRRPEPEVKNGWVRKCDLDDFLGRALPMPNQVVSNEEFIPLPQTPQQRAVEARLLEAAERNAKRLGLTRRQFLRSAAGMAAAFAAMNSVFGHFFEVDAAELLEPAARKAADYFVFDVQTHHVAVGRELPFFLNLRRFAANFNPELGKRAPEPADLHRENFIKEIFLDSQTDMIVVSGIPAETDDVNILPPDQMVKTRNWANQLTSSRRVLSHGLMSPERGTLNLEAMQVQTEKLKIDAWKGYTGQSLVPGRPGWWLDDEKLTYPALERSRKLGVRNICIHKGLASGLFNEEYCHPRDVAKVSKDFPGLNFLIYHSAFKSLPDALPAAESNFETTSYVPWVSDLCEARNKNPHMKNVYMELGSTFGLMVITHPMLCAHVLGMMIDAFGADHILWGTDSIWWGSPQWQIEALKRLEMPEVLMKKFGWKPLTREVKEKIFGLNAARVYKVDVKAKRGPIPDDYIDRLRKLRDDTGGSVPSNTQYGWITA